MDPSAKLRYLPFWSSYSSQVDGPWVGKGGTKSNKYINNVVC